MAGVEDVSDERPRTAIARVLGEAVEPYVVAGWRFARSGLRLWRRAGRFRIEAAAQTSKWNVSGEAAGFWLGLHVGSAELTAWQAAHGTSRGISGFGCWSLGALPGVGAATWDVVRHSRRPAVVADVRRCLDATAVPLAALLTDEERLVEAIVAGDVPELGRDCAEPSLVVDLALWLGGPDAARAAADRRIAAAGWDDGVVAARRRLDTDGPGALSRSSLPDEWALALVAHGL